MRLRGGPPTFPHAICENISPVEWVSQFIAPKCCTTTSASALNSAFLISRTDEHSNQLQRPGNLHYRVEPEKTVFPPTAARFFSLQTASKFIGRCRDLEKRLVFENEFTAADCAIDTNRKHESRRVNL